VIFSDEPFDVARADIVSEFSKSPKVYMYIEIAEILRDNGKRWKLPSYIDTRAFIELLAETGMRVCRFRVAGIDTYRYVFGEVSPFYLAVFLRRDSYLTHHSAMYLHHLIEQVPDAIYVNSEQRDKPFQDGALSQGSIDRAFSRPPRVTTNIAVYEDQRIYLLNGKFSNKLGVVELRCGDQETLPVTGLERTIVDITVRPVYSGGVHEVLKAYKKAAPRVSVDGIVEILKKLDYVYPYHQAIGFYLERSKVYTEDQINLIRKFPREFDFYLDYQMTETSHSKRWKLHYPKDI
jgi:predicted transcriptional regulator of viral defense system